MASDLLTDAQIAANARWGGWKSTNDVALAVAIALAESGGHTQAHHVNSNGSEDWGLWQVNSVHGYPVDHLLTPTGNARAAFEVYTKQGWTAWSTYKSGAYAMYLARGKTAAGSPDSQTSGDGQAPGVSQLDLWLKPITNFFDTVSDPNTWQRIGLFVFGGLLILFALFKLTGDNQLSAGAKTAIHAVTKAKVGK